MKQATHADGVLFSDVSTPRRLKPTDHRFKVAFQVLPVRKALGRLQRPEQPATLEHAPFVPSHTGGLGVYGDLVELRGQPLHCGDLLQLEIRHSRARARVRCLGSVTWVRINRDAGVFRMGVGFVGVDRRDLSNIRH